VRILEGLSSRPRYGVWSKTSWSSQCLHVSSSKTRGAVRPPGGRSVAGARDLALLSHRLSLADELSVVPLRASARRVVKTYPPTAHEMSRGCVADRRPTRGRISEGTAVEVRQFALHPLRADCTTPRCPVRQSKMRQPSSFTFDVGAAIAGNGRPSKRCIGLVPPFHGGNGSLGWF